MSPAYPESAVGGLSRKKITIALLENGEKVLYDLCNTKKGAPKHYEGFKYIGSGLIYSINGVLQKGALQKGYKNFRDFYVYGEEVRKFNRYTALTNRNK